MASSEAKLCKACLRTLPVSRFRRRQGTRTTKKTYQYLSGVCKQCESVGATSVLKPKKKVKVIKEALTHKACKTCQELKPVEAFSLRVSCRTMRKTYYTLRGSCQACLTSRLKRSKKVEPLKVSQDTSTEVVPETVKEDSNTLPVGRMNLCGLTITAY